MKKVFAFIFTFSFTLTLFPQITAEQKLDKLINTYTLAGKFNGSVLIARHGKILLEKGYGYKNFRDSSLNNPNTIFQIASVTKQFTSTVILKLVELNKLSLTDKLSKYYPDFPKGDSINIENLLTHTSGIYDWINSTMSFSPTNEQTLLAFLRTKNLNFSPGTNWSYSNSNYSLLGYIIQKVTGVSYENAVRKYIFNPLEMKHSGFDFKHLKNKEKATGYSTFSGSSKIEATLYDSVAPFAAGEIYSNIGDLYKWHEGLQSYKIISRTSLQKAYTPFKNHYGFGWQIDSLFGKRVTSHSGSISGFSSNLARIAEDSVIIILLNNKEESGLETITKEILSILYNQSYSIPVTSHPVLLSKQTLKKYVGTYEVISPHGPVSGKVTMENGRLILKAHGGPKLELFADKENHFIDLSEENEGVVEFEIASDGKVDKIVFTQDGVSMSGKKIR